MAERMLWMLFFSRFSTSETLEMLPSQRFWITWSMAVVGRDLGRCARVYDR
jgi:hypothetical protein